jgi:hypothetical protein
MFATGAVLLVEEDWAEDLYALSVAVATGTLVHYAWRARARLRAPEAGQADSEG